MHGMTLSSSFLSLLLTYMSKGFASKHLRMRVTDIISIDHTLLGMSKPKGADGDLLIK